ncbi:MAG: helix-turn-helix domain-containing protein [Dehalococcoidia bacterium]|nr:helix-turn-helix domain-containing protein [Dehalococcoidia bacterium]
MKPDLMSASEAAQRLSVHPKTIGRLLRIGKLAGLKIANRWLIEEAALAEFSRGYVGKRGWRKGRARKVKENESCVIRESKQRGASRRIQH